MGAKQAKINRAWVRTYDAGVRLKQLIASDASFEEVKEANLLYRRLETIALGLLNEK